MSTLEQQIEELKAYCDSVKVANGPGCTLYLLEGLVLPEGCTPARVDALLCPTSHYGYTSRLFLAEQVQGRFPRNWTAPVRVLERNWHAYSWNLKRTDLTLAQLVSRHLEGLTRP